MQESNVLNALSHPNIIMYFDMFEAAGLPVPTQSSVTPCRLAND